MCSGAGVSSEMVLKFDLSTRASFCCDALPNCWLILSICPTNGTCLLNHLQVENLGLSYKVFHWGFTRAVCAFGFSIHQLHFVTSILNLVEKMLQELVVVPYKDWF